MGKCSDLLRDKSLHGLARRQCDLFSDVKFNFHDVRRCNVVFSHQILTKIHVNASIIVKFLAGFLFMEWRKSGNI